jgi:sugar/nucleoside kinase (ribokinase family)
MDKKVSHANLAIGSVSDIPSGVNPKDHLDRFDGIVLTDGLRGAKFYSKNQFLHQNAFDVQAVDVTGAGDAFIAGYLFKLTPLFRPHSTLFVRSGE